MRRHLVRAALGAAILAASVAPPVATAFVACDPDADVACFALRTICGTGRDLPPHAAFECHLH